MRHTIAAFQEFLATYETAFRHAWDVRKKMDPSKRTRLELEFLPARLELIERPTSPTARWTALLIVGLFCIALGWATVGKLDIVAVAPGKTVAGGRTKIIQPAETAIVQDILVKDGQSVRRGDLLVELNATATGADFEQADESLIAAQLAELRYGAILSAINQGHMPSKATARLPADRLEASWLLAQSEFERFQAENLSHIAQIAQRRAEQATVQSQIAPLEESLAISKERVADLEKIVESRYVSRHEFLYRKQEMVDLERQLAVQRATLEESKSALAGAKEQQRVLFADARQKAYDGLRDAREKIVQFEPQVKKTQQRDQQMQLRSPVDGTIQQLAVHTVGGVVTPAQALMAVVPDQRFLEVEASILNKDIGFVRRGQTVAIKVESFPYTRYGYLHGIVESVSYDAAQDEKLGLIFPARVKLLEDSLVIDGITIAMTPGMTLTAEIKTGRRSVIDYLVSPLRENTGESMRER